MLRITRQYSTAAVKSYYERSDYYAEGPQSLKGQWFGRLAAKFGLAGEVRKEQFDRLVENRHPANDNQRLTDRTRADRVVGADFTFNVPKSISILWALTQDHRILDIVREAVGETLREIEDDIETRVHVGNQMHREKTGNVVGASWLHTTARPEGGVAMPHLHVHAWIANVTDAGNKLKAIDFGNVKADGPYFEARFHSRLAEKLQQQLGLAIERQGEKWFEVAGIDRNIIDCYSERTQTIERVAREKGITDPARKSELGARTRQSKSAAIAPEDLPGMWRWMLSDATYSQMRDQVLRVAAEQRQHLNARQAVDYAVEHQFTGNATVKERRLLTDATWRGIGQVTVEEIDREHGTRAFIRRGDGDSAWVTTKEVLAEEQFMLRFAREGRGRHAALAPQAAISRDWLSDEQQTAVRNIWQSHDRVMVVAGKAGVGKTTSAQQAVEGIEQHGHRVTMLAPTTKAVAVLKMDGFSPHTLARFLRDTKLQQSARGGVVWLDEAGLVSSPDLAKLFHIAESENLRVILAGDRFQHQAVERGKPLELLETESGIQPIAISRIRRQEDKQLREAVELLSLGRVKAGLDVLEKLGVFHELPDETRDKQLAQRYADAIAAGQSALVISPSNVEKDRVAAAIREELQQRGLVSRDEHQLTTLKRYEWDVAERQDPRRYHPGDVVEFRARAVGGFQAGDRVKVARVDEDRVWVEHGGAPTPLPMQAASVFSVFQPVESSFANGDLIRFTQNRGAKPGQQRLNNGDVFAIRFTKEGGIDLGNGVQFDPRQFPHFTQGLVTTSYSSQGDTKDRVFIAQSSKSFAASSPDQAYVSVSRARLGVEIYSDDVDGLKQAVSRKRPNVAAVELARDVKAEPEMSRVKRHIVRMRDAANRARITLENQLRRLAQLLPTRHDTTPSHAR